MSSMNIEEILQYLPHRYPFLLLDRVLEVDTDNGTITGLKNVSINEQFFQGHFPTEPIMPGVFMIEVLAQLAGVLVLKRRNVTLKDGYVCYLAGVDKTRFKKPVYPGDQLLLKATIKQERASLVQFDCEASVNDTQIGTSEILLAGRQT